MGSCALNKKETGRMVSRQKMAEALNMSAGDDIDIDDVWFDETALLDDHVAGILKKWDCIEDEIWAKVVLMEKNHRVAKAFIRTLVLTVNGGKSGLDGEVIGLAGFDNSLRDTKTKRVLGMVGDGCRMKMDEGGNIIIKRISKEEILCKGSYDGKTFALEIEKPQILFEMRKFQHTMSKEMRKDKPDWGKVRRQAICSISFVDEENSVLDQPVWLLIINIVALDFLRLKIDSTIEVTPVNDEGVENTEEDGNIKEDPYFKGLEAKVPPFVQQATPGQCEDQVLGHPVSWHKKVGPSPPVRSCYK